MSDFPDTEEKRVLRWGGLSGMLGSVILLIVFGIVMTFVGMESVGPEASVIRFPEVRTARTIENSLYLAVLILWVVHFLALYRALRATSLAPALFGSVLGILGLVLMAAGALPHMATVPLSDLYHAPGATPEDQATLVLLWQATEGIFVALLVAGLLFLPIGLIALGLAMLKSPAFGTGFGGISVVLGVLGVVAEAGVLADPASSIAVVSVLGLIVFHFALGWKVYGQSRSL